MDQITTRSDGTGTARMRSLTLDRDLEFEFTFDEGARDMDVAHAATLQLVVEETREMDRLMAEKEGDCGC